MPSATPALDPALAALLGRVWPSLPAAAVRAGALGFAWAAVSTTEIPEFHLSTRSSRPSAPTPIGW